MAMPAKKRFPMPVLAFIGAFLLPGCCMPMSPEQSAPEVPNPNIRFGMPAPAQAEPSHHEAYLLERPQYTLSYNGKTHTPNWVSWRLRGADIGHSDRGPFEPDPLLPEHFAKVISHVYDGSGFDRGHMCPAQDRSAKQEDMNATFYTTNIVPQSPNSNQRGWERLESYCRELAQRGDVLYIASGPAGVGGTGKDGLKEEIGTGRLKVVVPARLWKVILVLPHDEAEPRRNTRVIAIIMPNNQSVNYDWTKYRVAVKDVENLTGFTFLHNIPEGIARSLREHVDDVEVHVQSGGHGGAHKERKPEWELPNGLPRKGG